MKILVCGDGGMVYAREPTVARKLREAMYLGMPVGEGSGIERAAMRSDWWTYEIESFGRRAIMNDVTAAIGLVQLSRLPELLDRRADVARQYGELLYGLPGVLLPPPAPVDHRVTHYLYWIQTDKRDDLAHFLLEEGVYTTFRYHPLHLVTLFGHVSGPLPAAETASLRTLNLPCHAGLSDEDVARVAHLVREFVGKNE